MRLAVFDVDGVFTDGRLTFDDRGGELKTFNVRDGLGIKLLMQAGIEVAVISARRSGAVEKRMRDLGVQHVRQGTGRKRPAFDALLNELDVPAEATAYIGDDLLDTRPAMLTMIAETMLPEAYFKGGSVVGFSTLLGFLAAISLKTLG